MCLAKKSSAFLLATALGPALYKLKSGAGSKEAKEDPGLIKKYSGDELLAYTVVAVVLVIIAVVVFLSLFRTHQEITVTEAEDRSLATNQELMNRISEVRSEYLVSGRIDSSAWLEAASELAMVLRRGEVSPEVAGPTLRDIVIMLQNVELEDINSDRYLRIRIVFENCVRTNPEHCWWRPEDALQYR